MQPFMSRFGGDRLLHTSADQQRRRQYSDGTLVKTGTDQSIEARLRLHDRVLAELRAAHGEPDMSGTPEERMVMSRDFYLRFFGDG